MVSQGLLTPPILIDWSFFQLLEHICVLLAFCYTEQKILSHSCFVWWCCPTTTDLTDHQEVWLTKMKLRSIMSFNRLWKEVGLFFCVELIFSSLTLQGEEEEVSDCSSVRLTDEVSPGLTSFVSHWHFQYSVICMLPQLLLPVSLTLYLIGLFSNSNSFMPT